MKTGNSLGNLGESEGPPPCCTAPGHAPGAVFYTGRGKTVFCLYFLIWVVLNGRLDLGVAVLGIPVCVALTLFQRSFLPSPPGGGLRMLRHLPKRISFLGYLWVKMFKTAFTVMGMVFRPGREGKPVLVFFKSGLETDAGRAALAEAISLTAGTITVGIREDEFCIHALDGSLAEGIETSGFARRIKELEE